MTPRRRTLNNEDVCFVGVGLCTWKSTVGVYSSGVYNSRATDLGSGGPHTNRIHLGVYGVGVYRVGVYNSCATDFGSGGPHTS